MTSNQTARDNLSALAASMREQLPIIVEETRGQLKNLKLYYLGDVLNDGIRGYIKQGGKGKDLIEPSDGFHPNQIGQALLGQYMWDVTVEAGIIPPANPHNDAIRARFFPNEVKKTETV
jgi:acyloxyacyl hydrolase